jgi:hypothetical protein
MASSPWLLLIPQLPARPAYLRVKLWRRLRDIGAVPLKNAVYILPNTPDTERVFRTVLREVEQGGGGGLVCEANFDARGDKTARAAFSAAREADYRVLEKEARALAQKNRGHRKPDIDLKVARIRQRLSDIVALDAFGAKGRAGVETQLTQLEHSHIARRDATARAVARDLEGKVWVTRQGIHADRIACSWLIRRFIDGNARFRFVADKAYRPREGELRFDMAGAEFTHEGDKCSFEVLLDAIGRDDPALGAIAEIIHDLDIEDGKFARREAPGIGMAISGIALTNAADMDRVARGRELFDGLYARLSRRS